MPRRIAFLIYPDFQLLDVAGPVAAFEIAERCVPGAYAQSLVAAEPGPVRSSSGLALTAQRFPRAAGLDTLLVSGGDGSRAAAECAASRRFVQTCAERSRRVASVCSGTYLLAAAGVLDGRRATTHWSRSADFCARFPRVQLEPDRIFIQAGKFWSSAGITAGIDLALALIADDLGEAVARRTAQQMVVYHRRPGGQSQFSALLELEPTDPPFAALLDHIRANLRRPLSVTELAAHVHMSPRNFARCFRSALGVTPAKAVERLRAEAARAALESGPRSIQEVARSCGFGDPERMRRAFLRLFGASPAVLKRAAPGRAG